MSIKVIVHTVIRDGNEILLLRRSDNCKNLAGFWDLPGGSLEVEETAAEGAMREVEEETGLVIDKPELFHTHSNIDDKHYLSVIFYKNIDASGNEIALDEDHDDFEWVNINNLTNFANSHDTPDYFRPLSEKLIETN